MTCIKFLNENKIKSIILYTLILKEIREIGCGSEKRMYEIFSIKNSPCLIKRSGAIEYVACYVK